MYQEPRQSLVSLQVPGGQTNFVVFLGAPLDPQASQLLTLDSPLGPCPEFPHHCRELLGDPGIPRTTENCEGIWGSPTATEASWGTQVSPTAPEASWGTQLSPTAPEASWGNWGFPNRGFLGVGATTSLAARQSRASWPGTFSRGLRNGIFPAISVNKDVTVISDCSPPV